LLFKAEAFEACENHINHNTRVEDHAEREREREKIEKRRVKVTTKRKALCPFSARYTKRSKAITTFLHISRHLR